MPPPPVEESTFQASGPTMICRFISGGYAMPTTYLGPGRHLLGRSPHISVCCEDPLLDPHHLILEMGPDGGIDVIPIASRLVARLDGVGVGAGSGGRIGRIRASESAILSVGASTLRITSVFDQRLCALHAETTFAKSRKVNSGHDLSQRVVREPRAVVMHPSTCCEISTSKLAPSPPASSHSLIAAGVALVAGLTMALLLGHMMFAAFALVGAFTAVTTWGVGRFRHTRLAGSANRKHLLAGRNLAAELLVIAEEIEAHLHFVSPELCWPHVALRRGELWVRRPQHGDAYHVTLGLGDSRVPIEVGSTSGQAVQPEHQRLADQLSMFRSVPQVLALDESAPMVVAVTGLVAPAVIRSMVMQLAVTTGPADLRIVAVSMDPRRYGWMNALPHTGEVAVIDARDPVHLGREVMLLDDGDSRRVVLVTDAPELLTYRTAPVRRLLDLSRPITVIAELAIDELGRGQNQVTAVPAVCTTVISTDPLTSLGISARVAGAMSAELAGLEDPEDASLQANSLPNRVDLGSLTKGWESAEEIGQGWADGGPDPAPAAVIGQTADAILEIDLVADGPHGLVAGTTGSGKSELLRSLVISLAMRVSPVHLQFVLIDYKGGSTFDACCDLPHTVGLVTDLDEGLAERALISLEAELHRRERILRAVSASDLTGYRAREEVSPLARLVVVIDEFAALAVELPRFLSALVGIAQRGRSLGVHLILATQRPAGVIDDAIRANTDLRMALRLNDAADARDVVGDERPSGFPRGVPGRSMMRLGADEAVVFQAASSASILRARVEAIREASLRAGHQITHRPWLASLDEVMRSPQEEAVTLALGVIDDPAAQMHRELHWDRSGGLVIIGALGSGTTSTLMTIIDRVIRSDEAVLFVIDATGDPALAVVSRAANCAGVIGIHDRERLERLLQRWSDEIDRRQISGRGRGHFSDWVLAIDGVMSVRRSLDDVSGSGLLAHFERILAEGPAVGLVAAATLESGGGAAASLVHRFAMRWIHNLEDPSDGALYGVAASAVPPPIPGRIRLTTLNLFAQVYPPRPLEIMADRSRHEVQPVEALPAVITTAELQTSIRCGLGPDVSLLLGVAHSDLKAAWIDLRVGDHVMVLGPARSGKTAAAMHLQSMWRRHHPDGEIKIVQGRSGGALFGGHGSEIVAVADLPTVAEVQAPLLIVVDDAERVEDPTGRLTALLEAPHLNVLVVATARPEGLRTMYGHWTAAVRKSRVGVMMAAAGDLDGDLLQAVLPRRCPVRVRPGLAWIVDASGVRLVQIAFDQNETG